MNAAPVTTAAPNWAEITTEPHCPLCDYMLRGLTTPRCPECGYTFAWAEVLDASKRDHPYLFEHHPERNVWSYFKTVLGAMRPRRFWSQLHPAQYGSTQRLMKYWLLGLAAFAATVTVTPALFVVIIEGIDHLSGPISRTSGSFWDAVFEMLAMNYGSAHFWSGIGFGIFIVGLWPWLTYLGLQVFQVSMRKAKVRPVHVLRCVIYGLDLALPAMLLLISSLLSASAMGMRHGFHFRRIDPEWIFVGSLALVLLLHTDRLAVAYRRYLRFDHPRSVAISAQLIALLATIIVVTTFKGP